MSLHTHKIDGKVKSIHLYDETLKEVLIIIDHMWCDLAHHETKEKYATQWPLGYARIKELLKESI